MNGGEGSRYKPITQHRHMEINLHFVCKIATARGRIRNNRKFTRHSKQHIHTKQSIRTVKVQKSTTTKWL